MLSPAVEPRHMKDSDDGEDGNEPSLSLPHSWPPHHSDGATNSASHATPSSPPSRRHALSLPSHGTSPLIATTTLVTPIPESEAVSTLNTIAAPLPSPSSGQFPALAQPEMLKRGPASREQLRAQTTSRSRNRASRRLSSSAASGAHGLGGDRAGLKEDGEFPPHTRDATYMS